MLDSIKLYRKVALVSGLSAAGVGAAAILAYRFYATRGSLDPSRWSLWLPQYGVFSTSGWLNYFSAISNPENENEQQRQAQQQETDRLTRHFNTTVAAADEYNSELLELVSNKIFEADGLDALLTTEVNSSQEEEVKANKIKTLTFTRFIAAIWTVPLTFLLCRLMFCIYGRVVYLSNVAAAIHTTRSAAYMGDTTMQCPPLFDASYQRRLLRTFKSITPDAICRNFFRMVSQIVAKHVDHISYDEETSDTEMYALLSTINSEIEVKIASHSGDFWKSLLGTRDVVVSEEFGYVNDVMKEGRKLVGTRAWHVLVVDTIKWIVRQHSGFLKEAYKSVMDDIKGPEDSEEEDEEEYSNSEDERSEEESSQMYRTCGKLTEDCGGGGGTVIFDDNESQASAKSEYDISRSTSFFYAASRDARRLSPDPRFSPCTDRSRLVAEGSLEPLELTDGEEPLMYDANGYGGKEESVIYDSERDTGDHHSVRSTPLNLNRRSPSRGITMPTPPLEPHTKPRNIPSIEVNGIPFVRWATKLGKRANDIFAEQTDTIEDVRNFLLSQNFFLDVFASDSVTTLPRCQEETAPRFYNRC